MLSIPQSDIASLSNELFTSRSQQDELDSCLAAAQAELESRRGTGDVAALQAELQAARKAQAVAERDMQALQAELLAARGGEAPPTSTTPTKQAPSKGTPPKASGAVGFDVQRRMTCFTQGGECINDRWVVVLLNFCWCGVAAMMTAYPRY